MHPFGENVISCWLVCCTGIYIPFSFFFLNEGDDHSNIFIPNEIFNDIDSYLILYI